MPDSTMAALDQLEGKFVSSPVPSPFFQCHFLAYPMPSQQKPYWKNQGTGPRLTDHVALPVEVLYPTHLPQTIQIHPCCKSGVRLQCTQATSN